MKRARQRLAPLPIAAALYLKTEGGSVLQPTSYEPGTCASPGFQPFGGDGGT